jgi:Myb-like DNA-binding domain
VSSLLNLFCFVAYDHSAYATSLTETRVSDWLLQLFEPVAAPAGTAVTAESTEQQRHVVLKSNRQELNDLLASKAFDLVYLQEKLQIVLLRFNGEVYGKQVPVLVKLRYSFEPSCTRHLDRRAKQASNELYKFIVATEQKPRARYTAMRSLIIKKKPPEDVATAAKKAKKTKKNKKDLHEVKKGGRAAKPDPEGVPADDTAEGDTTATPTDNAKKGRGTRGSKKHSLSQQPDLLDLFDLDDKDDANEAAKMSQGAAKKPRIVANSGHGGASSLAVGISAATDDDPNSHWNLPPPDHGIFDQMGKVLRRIKWTDEEKNAVREGVRTLGVGKWMDVKKKYPFVLKNRTSVQIKDCYRTMSKNKEMDTEGV